MAAKTQKNKLNDATQKSAKRLNQQLMVRRPSSNEIAIYGLHAVRAAINNNNRKIRCILATEQAAAKLQGNAKAHNLSVTLTGSEEINAICGPSAVHQGVVMITKPLEGGDIHDVDTMSLVILLDQITDPRNFGALIRVAVAMGVEAIIVTHKHTPRETGLIAKTASGGLEHLTLIEVRNLAQAIEKIKNLGFLIIGLDSEGHNDLACSLYGNKIALILGAEGRGLRRLTRERCDMIARLSVPGAIKSLNVSNTAAVSLYIANHHLAALANKS